MRRLEEERAPILETHTKAQEEYNAAWDAYMEKVRNTSSESDMAGITAPDRSELSRTENALSAINGEIEAQQGLLDQANADVQFYTGEMVSYAQETATEVDNSSADVNAALDETFQQLQKLSEAYEAAYNAAYQSINGQYKLWTDKKDIKEVTDETIHSVGDMNDSMQKQAQYWNDYNANLSSLAARREDIAGLGDVIASFADGSPDSVNAIAGMAQASDAELSAMVANWQSLQKAQQDASASIAEISTDFNKNFQDIKASAKENISGMNLSGEARSAAQATIQGYIDGASAMLPKVTSAFGALAAAARAALGSGGGSGGGGGGKYTGADKMPAGYSLVGESGPELVLFHGGEEILDANETAAVQAAGGMDQVTMAPELLALQNQQTPEPMNAVPADRGSLSVSVQINVAGNATTETVEQLRAYGDDFKEAVLEVLEENDIDVQRRAYK